MFGAYRFHNTVSSHINQFMEFKSSLEMKRLFKVINTKCTKKKKYNKHIKVQGSGEQIHIISGSKNILLPSPEQTFL